MRLRRALPPQSCGKPRHYGAERRKSQERSLLKKTPKGRCYLIRLIWSHFARSGSHFNFR
ncbi:hypothetical protein BTQ01_23270 [Escherichia coli]|nr:hypothetical protein BTP98_24495 [Escherichia coli]PAT80099.1 hypothetical protein BTQ00_22515 [Escherichia coli]PAT87258.1 hypothetical protein BTP99_00785 [Escherichia coli]PAT93693.1 hypothetical protein BTQ01_23270 [Escherichia coli]PAT95030.1 hypothetical protein BTQ03_27645 [Escherichia coli]